jgi:hypothetical protein
MKYSQQGSEIMAIVREIWRRGQTVFFTLAGWLALGGVAFGQLPKNEEGPSLNSSTYVMAYFLVIFGVALGMLLVCRSSNRRERAKPEQFVEGKVTGEKDEDVKKK